MFNAFLGGKTVLSPKGLPYSLDSHSTKALLPSPSIVKNMGLVPLLLTSLLASAYEIPLRSVLDAFGFKPTPAPTHQLSIPLKNHANV